MRLKVKSDRSPAVAIRGGKGIKNCKIDEQVKRPIDQQRLLDAADAIMGRRPRHEWSDGSLSRRLRSTTQSIAGSINDDPLVASDRVSPVGPLGHPFLVPVDGELVVTHRRGIRVPQLVVGQVEDPSGVVR